MNRLSKILIIPLLIVMVFAFGMGAFAEIHSKWVAGDLIFYDGTTNIFTIRDDTDGVKIYNDLNLTFGTDNDATIEYDEAGTNKLIVTCSNGFTISGAMGITGNILMATTSQIQFHDSAINIYAADDGDMVINADATLIITSPDTEVIATTVTLDAATSIALEAGAGKFDFVATSLEMNLLTITEAGDIICNDAAGPTLQDEPATTTNPTLIPNRFDETTGIGWNTAEIHFVVSGVDEVQVTALILAPGVTDSCALGSTSYYWSDLFLANVGVINWNADVTLTHATDLLTFAGGNLRMGTTDRIEFRDDTEYVHSLNDGYIDVVAATGFRINSEVLVGGNLAGHGFTLYGESTGAYLDWQGAEGDILDLVNAQLVSTQTDLASPVNAIYGYCNAGADWTSGNMVGVRGRVAISATGDVYSATGVWAGVAITSVYGGHGLITGLNVEVSSTTAQDPNSIMYIQSLPGDAADFSDVPYLVFSETISGGGAGSHILFEVGHAQAGTIPDIGEDELFYNDTLQIAVNEDAGVRTPFFIPLSTDSGTFTTEYPIVSNLATGACIDLVAADTGIDIGVANHGIHFTGAVTPGNVTYSFINIGDYTTALAVAPSGANMFGVMHNVSLTDINVAYWYQAYYTKITPAGTSDALSIAGHALRINVAVNLEAVYGIQCHVNVSAGADVAQEVASISSYVNMAAGVTVTDRVVALQAVISSDEDVGSAGTVTGLMHVAYFGNRGTVNDTDAIVFLSNQTAATSDVAVEFDLDGTVTNVWEFNGTVCQAFTTADIGGSTEFGARDEYVLIPVAVEGSAVQFYIIAAETWVEITP